MSTHETRGQVCWPCPLPVAPKICRGADPSPNNQTCSLRATPACCTFASLALRILLASLREQAPQVSVPPLHPFFSCASDQLGVMPRGIHTGIESPRQEARLAGPSLCQLLRNSAEVPTQASTTRLVRSVLRQHVVHLPASRSAFCWHRSASRHRKSRYRLRTFFSCASDQLGIMPQGRHTGIETGQSVTKKARFAVWPRVPSDLVLICGRSQAVLRGTSLGQRELVQVGF